MLDPCWRQRLVGRLACICLSRNFAIFTLGAFASATGTWIHTVALGWLVLDLANSAFLLGLAGFARMLPVLLLGLA
jgi:hypothetical protein